MLHVSKKSFGVCRKELFLVFTFYLYPRLYLIFKIFFIYVNYITQTSINLRKWYGQKTPQLFRAAVSIVQIAFNRQASKIKDGMNLLEEEEDTNLFHRITKTV